MFPLKTERSSSGLIEFPNIAQAVLAIMKCNHLPIEGKGKYCYLFLFIIFRNENCQGLFFLPYCLPFSTKICSKYENQFKKLEIM